MVEPNLDQFLRLIEQYDVVPVWCELAADFETPIGVFYKVANDQSFCFLLESALTTPRGRYSFIGVDIDKVFFSKKTNCTVVESGKYKDFICNEPISELYQIVNTKAYKPYQLPKFFGGAVGYLAYDYTRFLETLPEVGVDDMNLPDIYFCYTDNLIIFDHLRNTIQVVVSVKKDKDPFLSYNGAIDKINKIKDRLTQPLKYSESDYTPKNSKPKLNMSKAEFLHKVNKIKEYIKAGDVIQVVLAQRIDFYTTAQPLSIYRALRRINPSPYMYYLKFNDLFILGSSPESFLQVNDGLAQTHPIAGTRPRGENPQADKLLCDELLSDEKERAEHIMLVDLGRNDLGKVCELGSIEVLHFMKVEYYSHVMHLVSVVQGKLKSDSIKALLACFPAGTVTGAPKVRAMQIIDELEPTLRGPYGGVIGYISYGGELDTCITIRTMIIDKDHAYVQTGAGVVADSVAEREYQETLNKAEALLSAVNLKYL